MNPLMADCGHFQTNNKVLLSLPFEPKKENEIAGLRFVPKKVWNE
jgi:hypothetical protein